MLVGPIVGMGWLLIENVNSDATSLFLISDMRDIDYYLNLRNANFLSVKKVQAVLRWCHIPTG